MSRRYAEGTTVTPEKSRMQVEAFLRARGATSIGTLTDPLRFAIQFQIKERTVRFLVPAPVPPKGTMLRDRERVIERETRRRWRALLLVLKAKFEAVESGITTFDQEFLASLVAGDGRTVGEVLAPAIADGALEKQLPNSWLSLPAGDS